MKKIDFNSGWLFSRRGEEDKAKLMEAFAASGKSVDEVIAWLKGE